VYSHLVANFLDSRNRTWVVNHAVQRLVHDPLHAELNFGWPGVALFFFVSGFVVTHAAAAERSSEYVLKRVLRIYPPLIVTAVLVGVMASFGILVTGLSSHPSAGQVVLGASLGNYLMWAQPVLIAVGWTLVIEIFFYLGVWATQPLLAKVPIAVPVLLLGLAAGVIATHNLFGTTYTLAAAFVAFGPILVLGQIVYLVRTGRIPLRSGALLGATAWVVFVYGMHTTSVLFADPSNSFMSNTALAFCVFVIAVILEGKITPFGPFAIVARRSYSLYLLHVPVGFTILAALVDDAHVPYPLALGLSLLGVAAATEIVYRLVERPSIHLGRRIASRQIKTATTRRTDRSLDVAA
jgi:peptidoglycan/LPS O-acetylase OafA/YrhL